MLYRHGVQAHFAYPSDDLSRYRLVLVPLPLLLSDEDADNPRRYMAGGGTLVVSYLSGVADPHARVRTGGYPGALRDLLGVNVEEFRPPESPITRSTGDPATHWSERVHLRSAESLADRPGRHAGDHPPRRCVQRLRPSHRRRLRPPARPPAVPRGPGAGPQGRRDVRHQPRRRATVDGETIAPAAGAHAVIPTLVVDTASR
ncbi:hypothetical protein HII36_40440 [Nonomuraea sp. NN258]|uniref:beta-galactosidase trimerization domain-containing protein n=1 Tax=Nonomuraea antri TaxID=2730852 RepID=UPI001569AE2F|nr:beta-galactosidase trimerization domain-containing protein [Nonomuraea antri]NRQ38056.1 hypothetical protein [Nonomuraea antri]